ncbi:TIR domain-containing protein [Burkholderia pyrrocinia]|uniref:TIR domain-containing protein n=1 Tax=Burkholderia pyrrocinia TaxID=60550 RepID=UPI00158E5D29|nr:nucleotide-binding protein [Burkholderia pyrrocinia]
MYYHVIVETDDKNKKGDYERCYELNCENLDDIIELIVRPYSESKQIYVNGRYIDHNKIRTLKVKSSEKTLDALVDIAQRSVRPGILFVYNQIIIVNGDKYVTDITKSTLKSVGEILKSDTQTPQSKQIEKNKVFIVHGRDGLAKTEAARFVEKLGFEAVILHEQVSAGNTIIEKIEEHANVGFAIVLYTPCDEGGLAGAENRKFRARQNVVFEHGYMISKLGRENVCALVKGDVEIPNDISGVVYVPLDDHGAWNYTVARELRNSGYAVDLNKI